MAPASTQDTTSSPSSGDAKALSEVSQGVMPEGFLPPVFNDPYKAREYLKERLALAYRIFAKHGFDEGVAGHITLRDPVDPTSFWLNPFGVSWNTMKASDLILVDKNGKIIGGGPVRLMNTAAFMIHHAVHTARPDVNCVAHSHSVHGRAFSALGRNIDMITQDACNFYNDCALYNQFRGIVLDEEEGKAIAAALGGKKAAILRNHGLLTCAASVEATVYWFVSLESACRAQLMADAAAAGTGGETIKISHAEAAYTHQNAGNELAGWFSAKPAFDDMAGTPIRGSKL
ncbi:class II aldolase/adducin N-terminal [Xylogone sp. PMI_703]|nr:class II aldolase/adducin N-terminal [Xylogone sp. PMI_703]